jgi:hypothetical protein
MPAAVRHAVRGDLGACSSILASAFRRDPWFAWLYPEPEHWLTEAERWFALVLDRAFAKGHTHVARNADSTIVGVASWIPPDVEFPEAADVSLALSLLEEQIGERAAPALGVIGRAGTAFHGRPPRFHCVYIAVSPDAQRDGIG